MDKKTEKYIETLKELNDARLEVIKAQESMIEALREVITLKDTIIKLKDI